MIEESLTFAGVTEAQSMLDVGCGIGGSSRHIAQKFNCKATGITLSPVQVSPLLDVRQPQVEMPATFWLSCLL